MIYCDIYIVLLAIKHWKWSPLTIEYSEYLCPLNIVFKKSRICQFVIVLVRNRVFEKDLFFKCGHTVKLFHQICIYKTRTYLL